MLDHTIQLCHIEHLVVQLANRTAFAYYQLLAGQTLVKYCNLRGTAFASAHRFGGFHSQPRAHSWRLAAAQWIHGPASCIHFLCEESLHPVYSVQCTVR